MSTRNSANEEAWLGLPSHTWTLTLWEPFSKSVAARDVWLKRTIKCSVRESAVSLDLGGSAHTGSVPTAATFSPSLKVSTPHDPGNWFEAVVQIWINCANIYKEWSKLASQEAETHISNQLRGFSLVRTYTSSMAISTTSATARHLTGVGG